jgi:hypothetical protein
MSAMTLSIFAAMGLVLLLGMIASVGTLVVAILWAACNAPVLFVFVIVAAAVIAAGSYLKGNR